MKPLVLAAVVGVLAGCSKDNPVAPHASPDIVCEPCPVGAYCPMACKTVEN